MRRYDDAEIASVRTRQGVVVEPIEATLSCALGTLMVCMINVYSSRSFITSIAHAFLSEELRWPI